MSGGEYNYGYHHLNDFIDKLQHYTQHEEDVEVKGLRIALRDHLMRIAVVMREVEWYDSGDSSDLSKTKELLEECTSLVFNI